MSVWSIVVAAGSGTRFGGPKQYQDLGGRRVVDHALGAARAASDGLVLVVTAERIDRAEPAADVVVGGGETRSGSVRAGLAAVPGEAEVIVVHDGVRPLAPVSLFEAVVEAVRAGADVAVPVVEVTDTLRRRDGGTVDRTELVAVQTPQGFSAGALRRAHAGAPEATDDAALVEAAGGKVELVTGHPDNIKITGARDLDVAAALLA